MANSNIGQTSQSQKPGFRVLSAGASRSGSTWLFNVARVMVSRQAGEDCGSGWWKDITDLSAAGNMVIKIHGYRPKYIRWASHVLYSYRDLRDVLASRTRIWNVQPTMKFADDYVMRHKKFCDRADMIVPFESLLQDKVALVREMSNVLGIANVDFDSIDEEVRLLSHKKSADSRQHDKENLYHKGHITDGGSGTWVGQIDPGLILAIEEKHASWFKSCGYETAAG